MSDHRNKLLFYIGTMGGGGAERVLLELLKHLDRNKYRFAVVVNRNDGILLSKIPSFVKIIDRSQTYNSCWHYFKRALGLVEIIKKENADLVISFLTGANRSLMRCRFLLNNDIKFLLREGNNPINIKKSAYTLKEKVLSPIEVKRLYPKADHIITVSEGIRDNFVDNWGIEYHQFTVIHNMVDIEKVNKSVANRYDNDPYKKNIIAVGRFVKQKGYNDLMKVFSKIKRKVPSRLIILGEGPERSNIEKMIDNLSLKNDVTMLGFVENPFEYLKAADLYLSTSHYEGFHLTIVEAMACGTVPVVTDCNYGPREIITDGKNGRLLSVGDIDGLYKASLKILQDDDLRTKMSANARMRAKDFDTTKIVMQYEKLFDNILNREIS